MTFASTISNNRAMNTAIEQAINEHGSQQALAKAVNAHQTTISHLLTGKRMPSLGMAKRLSKAVNNRLGWFEFMEAKQGDNKEVPHESTTTDTPTNPGKRPPNGKGMAMDETGSHTAAN